jgi:hypothetical protein
VKEGDKKAAVYIAAEFKKHGLQPLGSKNYFQEFGFPVNTFPSCMDVSINGTTLTAGKDFIVDPGMKKNDGTIRHSTHRKKHGVVFQSRDQREVDIARHSWNRNTDKKR